MQPLFKSFRWAFNGLRTVWKEEQNFRIETFIGALVLFFGFLASFSPIEYALLVIAITFVLLAEIVNTAIEDLATKIEQREDAVIGKIKDIMAGFVLVAVFGAVLLGVAVFFYHFN